MKAPKKNGAANRRNAEGDPKIERLGGVLETKFTVDVNANQDRLINFRAAYLARRFRLPETMAAAVSELAFGEARHG